jgi:hypothetical protein
MACLSSLVGRSLLPGSLWIVLAHPKVVLVLMPCAVCALSVLPCGETWLACHVVWSECLLPGSLRTVYALSQKC